MVFRNKETTNKVPPNIFRGFEVRWKVGVIFRRTKEFIKSKCYSFSSYKEGNKVCLVYSDCSMQLDKWIFELKWQKTVEKIYLETSKEKIRYRWCF